MNGLYNFARIAIVLVLVFATTGAMAEEKPLQHLGDTENPNTLSEADQTAGWKLLFDGHTSNGWRAFQGDAFPAAWKVADGSLVCTAGSKEQSKSRSDLVTIEEFDNFYLQLDWKIKPGGNGGVFFRVGGDIRQTPARAHLSARLWRRNRIPKYPNSPSFC